MLTYADLRLLGAGTAMAAFAAEGKRIPRRGEVGLKAEEIEKFEGYLFSRSLSLLLVSSRLLFITSQNI